MTLYIKKLMTQKSTGKLISNFNNNIPTKIFNNVFEFICDYLSIIKYFVIYNMIKGDINMSCDKCNKPNPPVNYKNKNYCNWYCAKKK